ncbi:NUC173 domain-containing protein [Zychaea mexicana]|uniref:NUC173 domain-containing protein n=1 Tax=Zychaea mexicana TaxID=64656 RepID=UPI0022FE52D4|nr:NUC173 domain-containing protein [Zychaea mexicana]KAI9490962.1 NUC173 domain-containing protein [Zychaea mexicana]
MEAKFEKIRKQVNSKLENQKLYARTLIAIEETIREQNGALSPVAYFGAIMTTLQATGAEGEVAGALVYLLDVVFPDLPQSVVRSKFNDVMPILEGVYEMNKEQQPVVRSIIGCMQELLANQDASVWGMPMAKKAYQMLLILSANASPKARKAAQDAVRNILSRSPPPCTVHPAANGTAEFILRVLQETTKNDQHATQQILALLQSIVPYWPPNQFSVLCQSLLQLPKFNNIFLTKATFEVFETLFDAQETDIDEPKFAALLRSICDMKPAAVDDRLLPTWLMIISKAYPAYAKINAGQCGADIATVFTVIFNDFQQESRSYKSIVNCLIALLDYCVTDDMVAQASQGVENGVTQIVSVVESGLGVHFQPAWVQVMSVQQALFKRLHFASSPLMNGCVALLGELRLAPAESYKEQLDKTLGAAIATMGPENFLSILPLNLEGEGVGRAFLLPLLKTYITNTNLSYFVNVLIPLGDRLAEKGQLATGREMALQAKVYETLVNQIWSLAPGFCDLPKDLCEAFNDSIAERFSSLLYSQPELRPTVAQSLQFLVEKNQALVRSAASDEDLQKAYGVSKTQANENLKHMSKFSVNYLAVFFNVYSQIASAFRGFLAEVVKSYLSIATPQDVNSTFKKVLGLLSQALESGASAAPANDPSMPPPMSHTMLDLAVVMIPYLDAESVELLYNGTVTSLLAKENEPPLQKKGYKILKHLIDSPNGRQVALNHIDELQAKVLEATASCTVSARKDRIKALLAIVQILPSSDLHFIPAILSETVISSKDSNEKTRNVAFSLLVEMGEKMKQGGVVKNSKLEGLDEAVPDAPASIGEYFTMVTAGLAGTTAHMIAATITAMSRIFFEFKDEISPDLALELMQTINVFVAANNREIVRAALGYAKVCIVVLDDSLVGPELVNIVDSLLKCSHQTRNHFKPKIRHIFERLIRRFGYDRVSEAVPQEDKKLISNIQKRRMRAKRKKATAAAGGEESSDEEDNAARASAKKVGAGFHDAYEEVLYGSESELEGSDDDEDNEMISNVKAALASKNGATNNKKSHKQDADTFIREGADDTPLDFLDRSALARITSTKPQQKKKQNLAKSAQYDDEGRMVFNEPGDAGNSDGDDDEEEEDFYMQAQKSADGFVRNEQNKIKFKKGGKDADDDDDAMDVDGENKRKKKRAAKQQYELIGKEYRSKRAGGDVKSKNKADPYAYMPLGKVIKKKGRSKGPRVTFTGRVKR